MNELLRKLLGWTGARRKGTPSKPPRRHWPELEVLEERTVLSTIHARPALQLAGTGDNISLSTTGSGSHGTFTITDTTTGTVLATGNSGSNVRLVTDQTGAVVGFTSGSGSHSTFTALNTSGGTGGTGGTAAIRHAAAHHAAAHHAAVHHAARHK